MQSEVAFGLSTTDARVRGERNGGGRGSRRARVDDGTTGAPPE